MRRSCTKKSTSERTKSDTCKISGKGRIEYRQATIQTNCCICRRQSPISGKLWTLPAKFNKKSWPRQSPIIPFKWHCYVTKEGGQMFAAYGGRALAWSQHNYRILSNHWHTALYDHICSFGNFVPARVGNNFSYRTALVCLILAGCFKVCG